KTASADTESINPLPTCSHALPFQRATCAIGVDPDAVKNPPRYRCGPVPSSNTASAWPPEFTPASAASQSLPLQRATPPGAIPPASVKSPATHSALPLPSSKTCRSSTVPVPPKFRRPSPCEPWSADHVEPFQRAIDVAVCEPALWNQPPTTSSTPLPESNCSNA